MNAAPSAHILVIDDDAPLRSLLGDYLRQHGYRVTDAADAASAEAQLAFLLPDAMVLDVMMPNEDGIHFAARLRTQGVHVPMLLLSARGSVDDRIAGLEAGANDYLPKPFEPRELLLRLKNLLARSAQAQAATAHALRIGAYHWHPEREQLLHAGAPVHLTDTERQLLALLAHTPNQPVSREQLQQHFGGSERQVDVLVNRLRKKLEPEPARPVLIETVRHQGYRLCATPLL